MRPDLNKLLCERERRNSEGNFRARRAAYKAAGEDDLPYRVPIKDKRRGYDVYKSFSENLNPLWGFIHRSVGRHWNDVYSEICSVFDKRSVINQHILVHLFQHVEVKTVMIDDAICIIEKYGETYRPISNNTDYYVHPLTGILTFNDGRRKARAQREAREAEKAKWEYSVVRQLGPMRWAVKETDNNCWFELIGAKKTPDRMEIRKWPDGKEYKSFIKTYSEVPYTLPYRNKRVVRYNSSWHRKGYDEHTYTDDAHLPGLTTDTYIKVRRQLSHREIKRYNLNKPL
jgi:hypothetical protein